MSSNFTKSVYVNAKFIKNDPASINGDFSSQGSVFVFQNSSLEFLSPEAFSQEADFRDSQSAYANSLINLNFDLTSLESKPYISSNIDLSKIYINLERKDNVDCIDLNKPLDALTHKRPSRTGVFTVGKDGVVSELSLEYQMTEYEAMFYDLHSYKLANLQKVDANFTPSAFPSDTLHIAYAKCLISSFRFKEKDSVQPAFYRNLIVVEKLQREYTESFADNFYYSQVDQKYYLNAEKEELCMEICASFFPTLALNDGVVIHGNLTKGLITNSDPDLEISTDLVSKDFYPDLCVSQACSALLNTICCAPSDNGLVWVNYQGTNYSFEDWLICPINQVHQTVIAIIKLAHVNALVFYKDFSAETVPVDIYAYNFRNIDYVNVNQNYTSFISNGSVQSVTTIYKAQALDLSKYLTVTLDTRNQFDEKVTGFTFKFKIYKEATTDNDASDYFLDIPITVKKPKYTLYGGGINGGGRDALLIVTDYATRISYYFNDISSGVTSVNVTDTTDGTIQRTEISLVDKSGILYFEIYNYFYAFSNIYRVSGNFEITSAPIIPVFQFRIYRNGSLFSFRDQAGNSVSLIDGSNYTQDSFGNYLVASDYLDVTYGFKLTFTLPAEYSEMWLKIGSLDARKITSAETLTLNKIDLYKLLDSSGEIKIVALLQNRTPFIIPFTFFNYSSSAPYGIVTQQLVVVIGNLQSSAKFSFNYQYANEIRYKIVDQLGNVLHGPISETVTYSTSLVEKNISTNEFSTLNGWSSLTAVVTVINRSSVYPHNKASLEISTNSFANTFKMLRKINPAEVKFYSDSARTTVATIVNRGEKIYAFLQLYAFDSSEILVANYPTYISTTPPKFELMESADNNLDLLEGVTLVRIDDYFYSFTVNADSPFDDLNLVLRVGFEPII